MTLCAAIFATDLPLPARIGLCVGFATAALASVRPLFLLRGRRGVRTLQWSRDGTLRAGFGPGPAAIPVTLETGSFRVGCLFLVLWLESRDGIYGVFIDAGRQDPRSFRRLCRWLRWAHRGPAGRAGTGKLLPSNPKA